MAIISLNIPKLGQPNATEDPKRQTCLQALKDNFNSGVETVNLADFYQKQTGMNVGTTVRRVSTLTSAEQTLTTGGAAGNQQITAANFNISAPSRTVGFITFIIIAELNSTNGGGLFPYFPSLETTPINVNNWGWADTTYHWFSMMATRTVVTAATTTCSIALTAPASTTIKARNILFYGLVTECA